MPFHEIILQVGNKEDMSTASEDGQLAAAVLGEYMNSFQEHNPNLRVFSAHLHMDKATPHLHIDFVPFTTGSKRVLDTRVSLKQALAAQGFHGGTRGDTPVGEFGKGTAFPCDGAPRYRVGEQRHPPQAFVSVGLQETGTAGVSQGIGAIHSQVTTKTGRRAGHRAGGGEKRTPHFKGHSGAGGLPNADNSSAEICGAREKRKQADTALIYTGAATRIPVGEREQGAETKNLLYRNIIDSNGLSHLLSGRRDRQKTHGDR